MDKKRILFPLEETLNSENNFFQSICSNGDLRFLLSGRCAIYYSLLDVMKTDYKKTAYLPLYTCETVVAPFVKAKYNLKFYSVDKNMQPIFDADILEEISVILICGYYGFCNYDKNFVQLCKKRGITVIEDTTHSILSSDGIDEHCDYIVGSMRKWIGVACGGFAIKPKGHFAQNPLPPHTEHLKLRYDAISQDNMDIFWEGELLLRKVFDAFGSDEKSEYILTHADYKKIIKKRRENYQYFLDKFGAPNGIVPVFSKLPKATVPSHFTIYAEDREKLQDYLAYNDVKTSIFWPIGPEIFLDGQRDTKYIYDHVLSIPCSHRMSLDEINVIAEALNRYR